MQISSINNQNFGGELIIPQCIKTPLERGLLKVLRQSNKEISTVPAMISKLYEKPDINIRIVGKTGTIKPLNEADFDVFIENTTHYTKRKIENGATLAERFLNALYEITK